MIKFGFLGRAFMGWWVTPTLVLVPPATGMPRLVSICTSMEADAIPKVLLDPVASRVPGISHARLPVCLCPPGLVFFLSLFPVSNTVTEPVFVFFERVLLFGYTRLCSIFSHSSFTLSPTPSYTPFADDDLVSLIPTGIQMNSTAYISVLIQQ